MLFQRRVDRAMKLSRERSEANQPKPEEQLRDEDPKSCQQELTWQDQLEKGDVLAMILSGLLVLVPVALIVLLVIVLFALGPGIFG